MLKAAGIMTLALWSAQAMSGPLVRFTGLDISKPPSVSDWQHFHRMTDQELAELWNFFNGRGARTLASWSWQWRMGWLRRCGASKLQTCRELLRQGLNDQAVVTRAEAATRLGERYDGKKNASVIKMLAQAFQDPRNIRHGRPLFVCERILASLHRVGGTHALQTAKKLSLAHSETKQYWDKLNAHKG